MASLTQKIERIRKNKRTKQGKARKRQIRKHGTTPAFAIHVEHAEPAKQVAATAPAAKAVIARMALKPAKVVEGKAVVERKSPGKQDPRSE